MSTPDPQVLLDALRRLTATDDILDAEDAVRIARHHGLPEDWIRLHLAPK